jgi:hypothetical protein
MIPKARMALTVLKSSVSFLGLFAAYRDAWISERTGLPYVYDTFKDGWRADLKAAGLPTKMWNRDFRAGGITEGGIAQATPDDRRKVAGHTSEG